MSLNKNQFIEGLKTALKSAAETNKSVDSMDTAMDNLATAIAGQVDSYIRTMTITIASGVVQVQGTPSAQANVAPIVVENGVS